MPRRPQNLFDLIPSSAAIRERLQHVEDQRRQLRVLLKTAEEIEREQQPAKKSLRREPRR